MPNPVIVRKVENKADFKAFFEFPWELYKDDPNWVPPLLSMRRELLDKDENPSWEYLVGDYYVAWRGEKPVGTIAAFANKRHNAEHEENISWFGFFEVYEDQEAATELLKTAVEWGKSHGYDAVRGPQSFTNMEECGLLIDNFSRPVFLMPYNPPYYQTLIENAGLGLTKVMDTHSIYQNWEQFENSNSRQRFAKLIKRINRNNSITVRQIDKKNMREDFELFKAIYNSAWERNWGFTPFTTKELDALVEALGKFFDPRLACFAYVDDEPVGFAIMTPDFNQVLHKAYARPGVPEPITLIKALWHWKIRPKMDWLRTPLLGVKAEHHGKGVDLVMFDFLMKQVGKTNFKNLDSGWILETNKPTLQAGFSMGMNIYKTYRFYETPINSK